MALPEVCVSNDRVQFKKRDRTVYRLKSSYSKCPNAARCACHGHPSTARKGGGKKVADHHILLHDDLQYVVGNPSVIVNSKWGFLLPQKLRASRFAKDAIYLTAGTAVAQFLGIVLAPVLSRLYAPEDFGLFGLYTALVLVLGTIAGGRYEMVIQLPKSQRTSRDIARVAVGLSIWSTLCLTLLVFWCSDSMAAVLGIPKARGILYLAPFGAAMFVIYGASRYYCMRLGQFRKVGLNTMMRATIGYTTNILGGLIIGPSGLMLTSGNALSEAAGNSTLWPKEWRVRESCSWRWTWARCNAVFNRYWTLCRVLIFSHLINAIYLRAPILGIGWLYGPQMLGQYVLAERFTLLPATLIATSVGEVYRQRATAEWQQNGNFRPLMLKTTRWLLLGGTIPYGVGILIAPIIVPWFLGANWRPAGDLAAILLFWGYVGFITSPVDKAALIVGAKTYIAIWQGCRCIFELSALVIAWRFSLTITTYLYMLTVVRILAYALDWGVGYKISKRANP